MPLQIVLAPEYDLHHLRIDNLVVIGVERGMSATLRVTGSRSRRTDLTCPIGGTRF